MLAGAQGPAIGPLQQATPDEEADDPLSDRRLKSLHGGRCEARFLKMQALGIFSRKHAVDDYRVIVEVGIEQSAEAVDEDDGAEACLAVRRHQTMPQPLFNAP